MFTVALVVLAGLGLVVLGAWLGYHFREIKEAIAKSEAAIGRLSKKVDTKEPEATRAVVIDPADPVQRAKYERDMMMKGLNPEIDE